MYILIPIILLLILILYIRPILILLRNRVQNRRYTQIVDRLLQSSTVDETREVFVEFLYLVTGEHRFKESVHIGDDFLCPITQEIVHSRDSIMLLPCGHKGKYTPMKEWVDRNSICPICRKEF
jgi:hypothetical protein